MYLEESLKKHEEFYSKYITLKTHLVDKVYKELPFRQYIIDENKILLNDHGKEHVETVLKRASDLVNTETINLSDYEKFILLIAILLHDVGVVFGREDHELNGREIYKDIFEIINYDSIEARQVLKIAECHTGKNKENGDKDKIYYLYETEQLKHGSIRNRLLAAILKFADELADDESRSFKQMLKNKLIPKNSEIFHAYSFCLYTPEILHDTKSIKLTYNIPYEFL
ncbi:HD domain-containing protein, partial [Ruminiclostridium cellobioparum]